jgi:hypothetical protein
VSQISGTPREESDIVLNIGGLPFEKIFNASAVKMHPELCTNVSVVSKFFEIPFDARINTTWILFNMSVHQVDTSHYFRGQVLVLPKMWKEIQRKLISRKLGLASLPL